MGRSPEGPREAWVLVEVRRRRHLCEVHPKVLAIIMVVVVVTMTAVAATVVAAVLVVAVPVSRRTLSGGHTPALRPRKVPRPESTPIPAPVMKRNASAFSTAIAACIIGWISPTWRVEASTAA